MAGGDLLTIFQDISQAVGKMRTEARPLSILKDVLPTAEGEAAGKHPAVAAGLPCQDQAHSTAAPLATRREAGLLAFRGFREGALQAAQSRVWPVKAQFTRELYHFWHGLPLRRSGKTW